MPRDRMEPVGRILGIDVARAAAVVGMVMVHIGPTDEGGVLGAAYRQTHGRASILFVLLAGLGVGLLAGDRSRPRRRRLWVHLAWRAAVLLPLGLALQLLEHGVLVILSYYALYYLVAGAATHLPRAALLPLAGALVVLGPLAYLGLEMAIGETFRTSATAWGDPPLTVARQLLVTGSYPLLTWSAPLLVGVWCAGLDLRARRVCAWLLGGGSVLLAAVLVVAALVEPAAGTAAGPSWGRLALADPHSQMPLWLLSATGAALAVLGLSLLVAQAAPRLVWPLAATGQLAFTIYVGHLLVLHAAPELLVRDSVGGAVPSILRFTVATVVAASLWRLVAPRGPLEVLLRPPWTWGRRSDRTAGTPASDGPASSARGTWSTGPVASEQRRGGDLRA
jgi:hypothetical protein